MSGTDTIVTAAASGALLSFAEAKARAGAAEPALATLLGWVEDYLMRAHADLGRSGAVCPFTRQAARLDTVRLAISECRPGRRGGRLRADPRKLPRAGGDSGAGPAWPISAP